jgi:hypothetical protein
LHEQHNDRARAKLPMETDQRLISQAVITVLRDVIGIDEVKPADDFFLIGGHSLLILRVIQMLRRDHGLELDARQFAVNSQVAALIASCHPIQAPHDRAGSDQAQPAGEARTQPQSTV